MGSFTCEFLITNCHVARTDCIFWYRAFQSGPYRDWSTRLMLLPFVSFQDWHGRISDHYYLFLQGVSQNLGYLLLLGSHPCNIWKITRGIRSDLEGPFYFGCLWQFLDGAPKWSADFIHIFHVIWCLCSIWHTQGYLLFSIGLISTRLSVGGLFRLSIFPKFFLILGVFWSSWKDCFAIARDVLGSLVLSFCCFCLETKNVQTGHPPSLQQAFECSHISSFSVRRRG